MTSTADTLIDRILRSGDDAAAQALLGELFSGFPAGELRRLLRSEHDHAVRTGAWIASELGAQARPLLADLTVLLRHDSRYVRFHAADAVLGAATDEDGEAVGAAVRLITDADPAVRWKAVNFLARAARAPLAAAQPYVSDPRVARLAEWLLAVDRDADSRQIQVRLDAGDPPARLFAAAAAARIADRDGSALARAALSEDDEVSSFAREQLEDRAGRFTG